jgi:hypothetical protein
MTLIRLLGKYAVVEWLIQIRTGTELPTVKTLIMMAKAMLTCPQ